MGLLLLSYVKCCVVCLDLNQPELWLDREEDLREPADAWHVICARDNDSQEEAFDPLQRLLLFLMIPGKSSTKVRANAPPG